MAIATLIVLPLLLSLGSTPSCAASGEFHSAEVAYANGEFKDSFVLADKARESTDEKKCKALLHLLQAKCLFALSMPKKVRESLVQAISLDPDVSFDRERDDPDLVERLEKLKVELKPRRAMSPVEEEASQEEPALAPRDSASRPTPVLATRQRLERATPTERAPFKDEVDGPTGSRSVEKLPPFSPQLAAGIGLTVVAALAAVFSVYGYVEAQDAKNELLAQSTPIDPVARRQLIDHGTTMNQLGFGALVVAGAAGVGGVVCFAGRF